MLFFAAVMVFAAIADHPAFLLLSFSGALSFYIALKGIKALRLFSAFLLPVWILVTLINSLTAGYGETLLFELFGKAVTLEALVYGAVSGCTFVSLSLWFFCWSEVIDEERFSFVFGKHFPAVSLTVMMILRFIPDMITDFSESFSVHKIRCGIDDRRRRLSAAINALSGVSAASLEKSIDTAVSMKSRGYGLKGKTRFSSFVFRKDDIILIAGIIISAVLTAVLSAVFPPEAEYGAVLSISVPPSAAIPYAILCFLPEIYDIKEALRWNSFFAKT